MNKTMNSATPKLAGEKRPDLAVALGELERSVSLLEELVGNLEARLSPVCSNGEQAIAPASDSVQSMCQVSANVRELDRRAYALSHSLSYLLSALEV